jgi:V8-like Glu-specific endopeptidase
MSARARGPQRALAAGFAALLASIAIGSGAEEADAGGHWIHAAAGANATAFWTPARMRQAQPLEVEPKRFPSLSPWGGGAMGRGRPIPSDSRQPLLAEPGSDFAEVTDPTTPDFRIHGAIFMSLGIFGYARCSGTAVHSRNRSVVVTAGHCINSGGSHGRWFPGRWAFVPAYRHGQRPFGVFPARWIDTTRQWRRSGSENFDVGAAVVGRNGRGELLEEAVGGAGIAWGLKPRQRFDVHGYPAAEPFDGETQRLCADTPFLGHDPNSFLSPGPLNLAVSCGVTGGASGGGWLIHGDTLNSVTDYGYFDAGSPDYGAYFGKEVAHLYGRAARVKARPSKGAE